MATSRDITVYHGKLINRNIKKGVSIDQLIYPENYSEDVIIDVTKEDMKQFLVNKIGYTEDELATFITTDASTGLSISTLSLKDVMTKLSTTAFKEIEDIETDIRKDLFTTGDEDDDDSRAVTLRTLSDKLRTVVRVNDKPMPDELPQLIYAPTTKSEGVPYFDTVENNWVWGKITDNEITNWNKAAAMTGRGRQEFQFSSLLNVILDRLSIPAGERVDYSIDDVIVFDDNVFVLMTMATGYKEAYMVDKFGGSLRRVLSSVELDDDRGVGTPRFYIRRALDKSQYSVAYNKDLNPFKDTLMIFMGARVYVYDPLYKLFSEMFNWKPDAYHCIGSGWVLDGNQPIEVYFFWDYELYVWSSNMDEYAMPERFDYNNDQQNPDDPVWYPDWSYGGIGYIGQIGCSRENGTGTFIICMDNEDTNASGATYMTVSSNGSTVSVHRHGSQSYSSNLLPFVDQHTGVFVAKYTSFGSDFQIIRASVETITPDVTDYDNALASGASGDLNLNKGQAYAVFALPSGKWITSDQFSIDSSNGVSSYWHGTNFTVDETYYELWYNDGHEIPLRIVEREYNSSNVPSKTELIETNLKEIYEYPYEQMHSVYTTSGAVFIYNGNDVLFAARGTLVTSVYVNESINEAFKSVAEEVANSIVENQSATDSAAKTISDALNEKLKSYTTKDTVVSTISTNRHIAYIAPSTYAGNINPTFTVTSSYSWVRAIQDAIFSSYTEICFLPGEYPTAVLESAINGAAFEDVHIYSTNQVFLQYEAPIYTEKMLTFTNIRSTCIENIDLTICVNANNWDGSTDPSGMLHIDTVDTFVFRGCGIRFKGPDDNSLNMYAKVNKCIDVSASHIIFDHTNITQYRTCSCKYGSQTILTDLTKSVEFINQSQVDATVFVDFLNSGDTNPLSLIASTDDASVEKSLDVSNLRGTLGIGNITVENSIIKVVVATSSSASVPLFGTRRVNIRDAVIDISDNAVFQHPSRSMTGSNSNWKPLCGSIINTVITGTYSVLDITVRNLTDVTFYSASSSFLVLLGIYALSAKGIRVSESFSINNKISGVEFTPVDWVMYNTSGSLDPTRTISGRTRVTGESVVAAKTTFNTPPVINKTRKMPNISTSKSYPEPAITLAPGSNAEQSSIHIISDIDSIVDGQLNVGDLVFKLPENS